MSASRMGLRVKRPGERMVGEDVELILTEHAASLTPPYQRLLGDAMRGEGELFGREDIVDAQWRIVEPILVDPPACPRLCAGNLGAGGGRRADRRRRALAEPRAQRQDSPWTTSYSCSTSTTRCSTTTRFRAISAPTSPRSTARWRETATGRSSKSCAANSATPTTSARSSATGSRPCTIPASCGCRTGWSTIRSPTGSTRRRWRPWGTSGNGAGLWFSRTATPSFSRARSSGPACGRRSTTTSSSTSTRKRSSPTSSGSIRRRITC